MTIQELPSPKGHGGTACGRFCVVLARERPLANLEVVLNLERAG